MREMRRLPQSDGVRPGIRSENPRNQGPRSMKAIDRI